MSELASREATELREWGTPGGARFSPFEWLWLGIVVIAPALLVALVSWLILGPLVAGALVVVYALAVSWWIVRQGRAALAAQEGARALEEGEAPRLANLVAGIGRDLGIDPPRLFVADGPPNALICSSRGAVLLVTRGLIEGYTRTELEAVVAHCLIRISTGDLRRASLAAALGGLAGPAGVSNLADADTRTVALTRYPTALASAVEKAIPAPDDRGASFWFVASDAASPSQADRAEALRDL